jgi:hypothetical protein
VETPLPSNSPHDHLILREHLVGSHGRWKRPCLQSASSSSARTAPPIGIAVPPNIPYLLLQGLYRGIIPATMGAVFAHGIRTGVYEFVQSGLGQLQDKGLAPVTDVQIQVAPRPLSLLGPHRLSTHLLRRCREEALEAAQRGVWLPPLALTPAEPHSRQHANIISIRVDGNALALKQPT